MARLAAMVMAAGASSRFNGCKHLADVDGKPMLQHAIDALPIAAEDVFCITGAWHTEILHAMQQGQLSAVSLLQNHQWQQGLGNSIACGIKQLAEYEAVLVVLADQIDVTSAHLERLIAHLSGADISCSRYGDKPGVPAVFNRRCFTALQLLTGDQGAKSLLMDQRWQRAMVPFEPAQVDIDTRDDLQCWLDRQTSKTR